MSAFPYQKAPGVWGFLKESLGGWGGGSSVCECPTYPCVSTHLYVLMRFLFTNFRGGQTSTDFL